MLTLLNSKNIWSKYITYCLRRITLRSYTGNSIAVNPSLSKAIYVWMKLTPSHTRSRLTLQRYHSQSSFILFWIPLERWCLTSQIIPIYWCAWCLWTSVRYLVNTKIWHSIRTGFWMKHEFPGIEIFLVRLKFILRESNRRKFLWTLRLVHKTFNILFILSCGEKSNIFCFEFAFA